MTQKFIDRDGLKVLWNQISLKDYPNNETLMAVIDAIDETKANKDELFSKSWNDLTDKPFYDNHIYEEIEVEKNLTFDGVLEGKEYLSADSQLLIKVSDYTYTKEELVGSTLTSYYNGAEDTVEIPDEYVVEIPDAPLIMVGRGGLIMILIVNENCSYNGFNFTEGTWFGYLVNGDNEISYISSSSLTHTVKETIVSEELKQLDEKFIPDSIARTQYVDENFALKSDLQNIDLSSLETKEDAQVKYDKAIEYTNKQIKSHVHSWDDLEDKPFITEQNIDDAFNDIFGGE